MESERRENPMSGSKTRSTGGRWLLLIACLVAFLLIPAAQATPGGLDSSFGTGGKVTTQIGLADAHVYALALQPDGKLVAAGDSVNVATLGDFTLARYNPDGKLDTSFHGTGKVTTAIGPSWDKVVALVRQPDGKLVAAGTSNNGSDEDFALARYNPDGSLDTSFNGTGKVTTPMGAGNDRASALARQPDGKLVVAGHSSNGSNDDLALARYNPDGKLDASFNGTGKVTTAIGLGDDSANALVLQPDGKIVVAGQTYDGSQFAFALVRYNPDGKLDTSFNGTGKVVTAIAPGYDQANALVLQPDGKLVAAGASHIGSQFVYSLARYNPNGKLDTNFGTGGKVTTPIGSILDVAETLVLQPDGRLIAAGYSYQGPARVFSLARYNPNGKLDTSFGSEGKVTTALGSPNDQANAAALEPDGSLVAAGFSYQGSNSDFALVRYRGSRLAVSKTGSGSGSVTGPGGISCGATCSAPFAAVPVTLTATASPGSSFAGWSGGCSGIGTCTVTMSADRAVSARFETPRTLTLAKAGSGSGTVSSSPSGISCGSACGHAFTYGAPVTLTATAPASSSFAGWSGDCSGTGTCTLTMSANHTVTATFMALCVVPKLKGKTLKAAKKAIKRAHCSPGKVTRAFSAKVKKGRVISQKPKPGKKLAEGSKVKFKISKGRGA
jgi:uncharacterized delta-60 repeat protein